MRRMLLTALASSAFALVAPGVAAASHEGAHHQNNHREHHHHGRARQDGSAGTIASFTNGVLTITLSGGSTVSGTVDGRTEIECPAAAPPASMADDHGQGGGDNNNGDNNNGDDNGPDGPGAPPNQGPSGDGHQNDSPPGCTAAALVPGAAVQEAELSVSSAGSVWETVELAQ